MAGKKIDITTAPIEDLDKLIAQLKKDQASSKKPVKKKAGKEVVICKFAFSTRYISSSSYNSSITLCSFNDSRVSVNAGNSSFPTTFNILSLEIKSFLNSDNISFNTCYFTCHETS